MFMTESINDLNIKIIMHNQEHLAPLSRFIYRNDVIHISLKKSLLQANFYFFEKSLLSCISKDNVSFDVF